ncbi:LysR family transcriptional regulator [Nocardia concava]|uniref:LysR family transcriptional regulator n=1 Tax=Nocardia concava TaxID=257281 RepID=UPI0002F3576A|nr:LysR family transcriptional regulator [Nocardia concava]
MERHEIDAFLSVADELHFGRAADRLRVSPSRVSQTIAQIERRVGAALFERTSRRVALTPIGRQFLAELRPAQDQVERAIRRAINAGRGFDGGLEVGFYGAAAGKLILDVAEEFRREHPGIEVRIKEIQLGEVLDGWHHDACDMVLSCRPIAGPDIATGPPLFREDRMLAVSTRHPLAARQSISLEDLTGLTLIRMPESVPSSIRHYLVPDRTPGGRPITHGKTANTFQEILALVGANEGVFMVGNLVTDFYSRPDVVYLPITDAPPVEWGFAWKLSRETARIRAFNEKAIALCAGARP